MPNPIGFQGFSLMLFETTSHVLRFSYVSHGAFLFLLHLTILTLLSMLIISLHALCFILYLFSVFCNDSLSKGCCRLLHSSSLQIFSYHTLSRKLIIGNTALHLLDKQSNGTLRSKYNKITSRVIQKNTKKDKQK